MCFLLFSYMLCDFIRVWKENNSRHQKLGKFMNKKLQQRGKLLQLMLTCKRATLNITEQKPVKFKFYQFFIPFEYLAYVILIFQNIKINTKNSFFSFFIISKKMASGKWQKWVQYKTLIIKILNNTKWWLLQNVHNKTSKLQTIDC